MKNRRRCEICNIDVHRAFHAKYLRTKKHLESIREDEIIIPEGLIKEEYKPVKNKT